MKTRQFRKDESGAVTVDWVVLVAALVGLAVAIGASISEEIDARAGQSVEQSD